MSFENLSGQVLGQYELRELLGQGGMGAVYRAVQANLKLEVAIKILPTSLAQQSGYLERFNREAEIAVALQHPHIVPTFDYGTQRGISYVVMRLLTGGNLAQRINERLNENLPLPSLGEAARMLDQLASALDYAHSQGVIHRDIKTSNIMFDTQGNAYVVDFGIAKLLGANQNLTSTGMTVGTSTYMPPEQWRSEPLTPAADQYTVAIVMYIALTGRFPYQSDTAHGLMYKHFNEMPTPPHQFNIDIPEDLSKVLYRALAKKPEDRFPSMLAFSKDFQRVINGHEGQYNGFFTFKVGGTPLPFQITPASPALSSTPPVFSPSTPAPQDNSTIIEPPPPPIPPLKPIPPAPKNNNRVYWGLGGIIFILVAAIAFLLSNRQQPNVALLPTETTTLTSTALATNAPTYTATTANIVLDAPTATETSQPSPTVTVTPTPSPSETSTPTPSQTSTATATATESPTATSTSTVTASATLTATATYTETPTPALTPTPLPADYTYDFNGQAPSDINLSGFEITKVGNESAYCGQTTLEGTGTLFGGSSKNYSVEARILIRNKGSGHWWIELRALSDDKWARGYSLFVEAGGAYLRRSEGGTNDSKLLSESSFTSGENRWYALRLNVKDNRVIASVNGVTVGQMVTDNTFTSGLSGIGGGNVDLCIDRIIVRSLETSGSEDNFTPTPTSSTPANSALPGQIVFTSRRYTDPEILMMNPSKPALQQRLTFNPATDSHPVLSPDGRTIAFESNRDGNFNIYIAQTEGTTLHRLTQDDAANANASWSSDGKQIAYNRGATNKAGIYVVDLDSLTTKAISQNEDFLDYNPVWSPDGQKIAFESARNGNRDIFTMNSDGSGVFDVSGVSGLDADADWSPDGTEFAFASNRDGNYEIYVMDTQGHNVRRLTSNGADDEQPTWSPDGQYIAFVSDRSGNKDIWVMRADGSRPRNLTADSQSDDYDPDWGVAPSTSVALVPTDIPATVGN